LDLITLNLPVTADGRTADVRPTLSPGQRWSFDYLNLLTMAAEIKSAREEVSDPWVMGLHTGCERPNRAQPSLQFASAIR
jgi:hypothetical protein